MSLKTQKLLEQLILQYCQTVLKANKQNVQTPWKFYRQTHTTTGLTHPSKSRGYLRTPGAADKRCERYTDEKRRGEKHEEASIELENRCWTHVYVRNACCCGGGHHAIISSTPKNSGGRNIDEWGGALCEALGPPEHRVHTNLPPLARKSTGIFNKVRQFWFQPILLWWWGHRNRK